MIKLINPLKIRKNGEVKEVNELEITAADFTGRMIMEAEKNFLTDDWYFPANGMEHSRAFLAYTACQILSCRIEDFQELSSRDFLAITNIVKGFFIGLDFSSFLKASLELKEVEDTPENTNVENSSEE